jgi:N-methylhydantoinase A
VRTDLATAAVQEIADAMGIDLYQAAEGITRIANEHMFGALRLISVEQGYDPRDFALCGFGGAGPLHANALGILLNAWPVIVPPGPGVLCAYGDATTRVKDEASRSLVKRFADLDNAAVATMFKQLADTVQASLVSQEIPAAKQQINYEADVRYQGQALLLTLEVDLDGFETDGMTRLGKAFDAEHEQLFTFSLEEAQELVNLRAIARGPRPSIAERERSAGETRLEDAVIDQSQIYYQGAH